MSIDVANVETQVIDIVSDHLRLEPAKILPASRFSDDLGADSLDRVELVMKFEEKFGIEIPDEAAEKIATVQDAVGYIKLQLDKA